MLVESGSTEHEIDFERHRCRPGGVLYLRPGQVQCFVRQAGAQGWVLLFRPDFLPHEPMLEARLGPASAVSFSLAAGERRCIGLAMRALAEAYGAIDGDAAWPRVLQQLLLAVLLQVARAQEEAGSSAGTQAPGMLRVYRRFVHELEHAFGHTREVAWFARRIGCSTKTLSRACEALAGASPKRVIERRVALEAKRLLAHSTLAVSSIGLELGFSEPTNFVKFFRRCEGVTPAAFRESAAPG
jgi:AraC-like DNA-binding protein